MKLRNKKTGEIGNLITICATTRVFVNRESEKVYNSLAELNEEWEDVPEEPKEYWYITSTGIVAQDEDNGSSAHIDRKKIGNYFETEEEAELAVQKLKAWKRLQKKFDFHIPGWDVLDNQVIITTDCDFDYVRDRQDDGLWADLDLVFNGNLLIRGEE